jgi:hypothetical protein
MVRRVSPLRPWFLKMGALIAVGASVGCTLVLDASPAQCQRTDDCARFAGTICNVVRHLCVANRTDDGGPGSDGAVDDPADAAETTGCAAGTTNSPPPGFELLNACTDATCLPFDNRQRLRNLSRDGVLPPLPEIPGGRP